MTRNCSVELNLPLLCKLQYELEHCCLTVPGVVHKLCTKSLFVVSHRCAFCPSDALGLSCYYLAVFFLPNVVQIILHYVYLLNWWKVESMSYFAFWQGMTDGTVVLLGLWFWLIIIVTQVKGMHLLSDLQKGMIVISSWTSLGTCEPSKTFGIPYSWWSSPMKAFLW